MRARSGFLYPGRLPGRLYRRISAEIQLLGLLIPFYSSGIMRYSNPNPICGVRRWHEDDVTAGTSGEKQKITGLPESHPLHWGTDYC